MTTASERVARRAADRVHRTLAEDLRRLCADAGVTQAALARAAAMDSGSLARILAGTVRPSVDTYARLATALGADLSSRLYPNTGPAIRDRHQAPMLEALLTVLHPRWSPFTEVAVWRPSRAWIDAALHDPRAGILLASELQSELRRLEQLVRWSAEKAASLPSWEGWVHLGGEPRIERLLVVRRTRADARGRRRLHPPAPRRLPSPPGRRTGGAWIHGALAGTGDDLGHDRARVSQAGWRSVTNDAARPPADGTRHPGRRARGAARHHAVAGLGADLGRAGPRASRARRWPMRWTMRRPLVR
jgi:transcriptional regulator with XRE-family HTH domain